MAATPWFAFHGGKDDKINLTISIMRTILLSIITLALSLGRASGQDKGKIEFSLGSGVWSSSELFDGYTPGFLLSPSFKTYIIKQYSGAFYATAKYFVSKRVSLGIAFAYENESGTWQRNENVHGGAYGWEAIPMGSFKRQAFTFAPELYVTYAQKGIARLYWNAGVGITYRNEVDRYSGNYYAPHYTNGVNSLGKNLQMNNNKMHLNLYYSPIGISAGKALRWFAEIGIGYKGILNTGVSYKI